MRVVAARDGRLRIRRATGRRGRSRVSPRLALRVLERSGAALVSRARSHQPVVPRLVPHGAGLLGTALVVDGRRTALQEWGITDKGTAPSLASVKSFLDVGVP